MNHAYLALSTSYSHDLWRTSDSIGLLSFPKISQSCIGVSRSYRARNQTKCSLQRIYIVYHIPLSLCVSVCVCCGMYFSSNGQQLLARPKQAEPAVDPHLALALAFWPFRSTFIVCSSWCQIACPHKCNTHSHRCVSPCVCVCVCDDSTHICQTCHQGGRYVAKKRRLRHHLNLRPMTGKK